MELAQHALITRSLPEVEEHVMIAIVEVTRLSTQTAAALSVIKGRDCNPITIAENASLVGASELELRTSMALFTKLRRILAGLIELLKSFGPRLDLLDTVVVSVDSWVCSRQDSQPNTQESSRSSGS